MTSLTALSLLLLAGAVPAIAHGLRRGPDRRRRFTLAVIRAAGLVLVAVAFVQPTLYLTRLAREDRSVVLLVDVSASMGLFDADTALSQLAAALRLAARGDGGLSVHYACFGDSVRQLAGPPLPGFSDPHSRAPLLGRLVAPSGSGPPQIIIVSDGNWESGAPGTGLGEASCYYVPLVQRRHSDYLSVQPIPTASPVPRDSLAQVPLAITGYSSTPGVVTVSVRVGQRLVRSRSLTVPAGHIEDTAHIALPTGATGTHLYEIEALLPDTSVRAVCHFVQRVDPRFLGVAHYARTPSLDKRFLSIAIDRHSRLRAETRLPEADVVVFHTWDEGAREVLNGLAASATAVFVGCVPCTAASKAAPALFVPRPRAEYARSLPASLPPPSSIAICRSGAPRILASLFSATVSPQGDTAEILYETTLSGGRALVLAAAGLWRWDFWPRAVDEEASGPRFSDFLVDRILELAVANANRDLHAYPVGTPLYETDSVAFALVLPSAMRSETSIPTTVVVISETGDTAFRTTTPLDVGTGAGARLTVPPLRPGTYRYECVVSSPTGSTRAADRMTVMASNAELRAEGQNRMLLEQIASPLPADDTAAIRRIVERMDATGPVTRRLPLHLRQSPLLLALLLLVLAAEWVLRRAWRFD